MIVTLPQRIRAVLLSTLATVLIACASGGSPSAAGTERSDHSRMDTLEFRNKNFRTIFDAIRATHPDWLNATGGTTKLQTSTGGQNTPTLGIFIEGQSRTQPMEYLTRLTPEEVRSVRRIGPSEALSLYSWPWASVVVTPGH
jgi:hypothetical protein